MIGTAFMFLLYWFLWALMLPLRLIPPITIVGDFSTYMSDLFNTIQAYNVHLPLLEIVQILGVYVLIEVAVKVFEVAWTTFKLARG